MWRIYKEIASFKNVSSSVKTPDKIEGPSIVSENVLYVQIYETYVLLWQLSLLRMYKDRATCYWAPYKKIKNAEGVCIYDLKLYNWFQEE